MDWHNRVIQEVMSFILGKFFRVSFTQYRAFSHFHLLFVEMPNNRWRLFDEFRVKGQQFFGGERSVQFDSPLLAFYFTQEAADLFVIHKRDEWYAMDACEDQGMQSDSP